MTAFFYLTLFLQSCAIAFDEFYFHHARGLKRWERIGHPLDSLTVLACLAFLLLSAPTSQNLTIYVCLSAFSCLFVTKDEWVHAEVCRPTEQWLHAVLFTLHPIALAAAGGLWWTQDSLYLLRFQLIGLSLFAGYQITYWNFLRSAH